MRRRCPPAGPGGAAPRSAADVRTPRPPAPPRLRQAVGVAQHARIGRRLGERAGDLPEPRDVPLEPVEQHLDLGNVVRIESFLQPAGPEALALPAEDGAREAAAPRRFLDHRRDRRRDVGQEGAELVAVVLFRLRLEVQQAGEVRGCERAAARRPLGREPVDRTAQLVRAPNAHRRERRDDLPAEVHTALLGEAQDDRASRLLLGRRDVDDQTGGQARREGGVERVDVLRRLVGRDHDLGAASHHLLDHAAQNRLHAIVPARPVEVVDDQQVEIRERLAELPEPPARDARRRAVEDRVHRLLPDPELRVELGGPVRDRAQQVRLPDPGRPEHEERVVAPPGRLGHAPARRRGDAVARVDVEVLEGRSGAGLLGHRFRRPWSADAGTGATAPPARAPRCRAASRTRHGRRAPRPRSCGVHGSSACSRAPRAGSRSACRAC
jgi:hypothetical protein